MTPWITKPVPFNIGQGAAATSEPMAWIDDGYSGSEPTITTTTTTNDTTQPNGADVGSGFSSGNALSVATGDLKIKIVGTFGEGGSLSNTVIGLTSITQASNISDVEMGIGQSYVKANIMFNEPGYARPNEQSGSAVVATSGDVFEIRRDGTTLTWHQNNGSAFYTVTGADEEDFQNYSSSDDGHEGKHIFV